MALEIPTREEIGLRVRTVREMAHLSARRLRLLLGSTDNNLISDIEQGTKKIVDYERLAQIAVACAGQGQLESVESEEVLDFITGRIEWDVRPRPSFAGAAPPHPTVTDRDAVGEESLPRPDGHLRIAA